QGRARRAAQLQRLPHAAHQRSAGDRGPSGGEQRGARGRGRARDVVRDAGGGERGLRGDWEANPETPGKRPAASWMTPRQRFRAEVRGGPSVGLALGGTVEGLQVFSPVRTASIVDVTTNTLGALLGAGGVALLIAAVVAAKGARSYLGVPTLLVAGAYAGAA